MNPEFINSQILAYLGDSVIELMARDYLIKESGLMKVNELYQRATHFVSAKAHTDFIHHCLDHSFLSEEEVSIFVFEPKQLDDEELELYKKWMDAKAQKNFEEADQYRAKLIEKGII